MPGQAATQEVSGSALLRRSFRKFFPPAVHGEGAYLWDARGKQYLDFSGSAGVNFIGHGVAKIIAAMTEQGRALEVVDGTQFTTPIAEQYAEELLAFAGDKFRGGAVYFCSGESEAVESALKLARQYQAEIGNRQRWQVIRKAASEIEQAVAEAEEKIAAVVLDPVADGVAFSPGCLERIAEVCYEHNVLLVADEVTSGLGRTGRNFAVAHSEAAPDILITAKGLSSGYAPLGAVIISRKVVEVIASGLGSFIHGFTYSPHPISLASGRAVLKYVLEHKLVGAADSDREGTIAHQLKQKLNPLRDLAWVGDVHGIGLLWAVDLVCDKVRNVSFPTRANFSGKVAQTAIERGLLVYPVQACSDHHFSDQVLIAPPAVISSYQVSWACEQLAAAIEQASAQA